MLLLLLSVTGFIFDTGATVRFKPRNRPSLSIAP